MALVFEDIFITNRNNYLSVMIILQCAVLFAFLAAGEFIVTFTGIPIPSSII